MNTSWNAFSKPQSGIHVYCGDRDCRDGDGDGWIRVISP